MCPPSQSAGGDGQICEDRERSVQGRMVIVRQGDTPLARQKTIPENALSY